MNINLTAESAVPAGGIDIGDAIGGGTVGAILFVGTGSVVQQNSTKIFWDDPNNRLGIGTNAPSATLHVFDTQTIFRASNTTGLATYTAGLSAYNNFGTPEDASAHTKFFATNGSTVMVQVGETGKTLFVQPRATTNIGIISKNIASQTANNYEAQNSSGTPYVTIGPDTLAGDSTTKNWINLTGTFPTTLTALTQGVLIDLTGAGSSGQHLFAVTIALNAGYTGNQSTRSVSVTNSSAGTGTNYIGGVANYGMSLLTESTTTGTNVGGLFQGRSGDLNFGIVGIAGTAKNAATNVGAIGLGRNTGTTPVQLGGYFGLNSSAPTLASAALMCDNSDQTSDIFVARDNGTAQFVIADGGLMGTYKAVATAGWGLPAIYAQGRAVDQTARSAALATYTVGAADGSFEVSANVLVTASVTHSFSVDVSYTDEGNTARTLILPMAQLGGSFISGGLITNVTGVGPYESPVIHIRCKAATAITIRPSAGTFTSVTYNAEGTIKQVA